MDASQRVLTMIATRSGRVAGYGPVAEPLGISEEAARGHVKDLESEGCLEVDRSGKPHIIELLDPGHRRLTDLLAGDGGASGVGKCPDALRFRAHKVVVRFRIHGSVSDEARERLIRDRGRMTGEDERLGKYGFIRDNRVRITSDYVIVRLEDVVAPSAREAKDRVLAQAWEYLDMIDEWNRAGEGTIPVRRELDRVEIEVSDQHMASEDDPLAEVLGEVCDEHPTMSPSDFLVVDEDGEELYTIDGSTGWELESLHSLEAEDLMTHYQEVMLAIGRERLTPEHVRTLAQVEVEDLEELVELADQDLEQLPGKIDRVVEELEKIRGLLEDQAGVEASGQDGGGVSGSIEGSGAGSHGSVSRRQGSSTGRGVSADRDDEYAEVLDRAGICSPWRGENDAGM